MTATLAAPTTDRMPAFVTLPHNIPTRVARTLSDAEVAAIAQRFAALHNAHVIVIRDHGGPVTSYPFATADDAETFRAMAESKSATLSYVVAPSPMPWRLVLSYANGQTETLPYPSRQAARDAGAWYRTHCEQDRPTTVVKTSVRRA